MKASMNHHILALATLLACAATQTVYAAEKATKQPDATTVETQDNVRPGFEIAPKAGLTSFSLKGGEGSSSAKSGISIGAMGYIPLTKTVDFEFGAEYLQAGGQDGFFGLAETDLEYLSIPLGARWHAFNYGSENKSFFSVRGGVAPSFLLSAKTSVLGESEDIKDQMNTMDYLGYLGLGMTCSLDHGQQLLFELNYMDGLTKAFKDSNAHNEGMVFAVAYSIPM